MPIFSAVVSDGQQALAFNRGGRGRLVVGPRRTGVFREQLEYLNRRVASQYQYLAVKYRDGKKEHIPGPQEMFENRLVVESIQVKNAIALDANHVLIVYKQNGQEITRRVVRGPTLFIPDAQEWIHDFDWHGCDLSNLGRWIPHAHKFTKLSNVPSQIYLNVRDVRTNDDTLLLVKLMVFYELSDIETMLNYTHDPIADFINAVSSDIIAIASQMSYEEFLQQTHQLNQLASYPQLTSRADRIGFKIKKVFYRGYQASSALQATHDEAVEKRTKLKLYREEEEQQQHLQEFKLKREKKRTKLKQEMERKIQEHTQELERLKQDAVIIEDKLIHEASLKKRAAEVEAKVTVEKAQHLQRKHFLSRLESLGVDMTKYLVGIQPEFVPEKEIVVGPAFNTATTPLTPVQI